ncbi:MAG: hypothetical protein J6B10_07560 [Lachnospiraceae bacterium]|nr:hypothetical protein [Lachnospiraceae bacterium]
MVRKSWKCLAGLAVCTFAMVWSSLTVHAEPGVTGYPKVVQAPGYEGEHYLTVENAKEWEQQDEAVKKRGFIVNEPAGFYELNGQVVYLRFSQIVRMTIMDGYFLDENGLVHPYNAGTKAAIDAQVNAALAQIKAQAAALYGIDFSFRKDYDACSNYRFVRNVLSNLGEYPAGSVPVIANATKAQTGKNLKFRQRFASNEWVLMDGSVYVGIYSYDSNVVQTDTDPHTTAHEMGHGMEAVLNAASNGALRNVFRQLNGGAGYSQYYFYSGNEELRQNVPDCFVSDYAATSYAEDFAEIFAEAMLCDAAEMAEYYQNGYWSGAVYQKVMYVKQLFNQYAGAAILN